MEGGAGGPQPPWILDGPPSVPPSGPPSQNFWGWPCKYQIAATLYINKHNHPLYMKKHTPIKLYWANIIIILHIYYHIVCHNFQSLTYCGNVQVSCVFNGGCVYAYIMDIIRKKTSFMLTSGKSIHGSVLYSQTT